MRSSPPGFSLPTRRLACVLIVGILTACSPAEHDARASGDATAAQVGVHTEESGVSAVHTSGEVGRIVGKLPGKRRKAVRKEVTAAVDRWWEAAYLTGAGPATDLDAAFPGFTPGARKKATFDRLLTTNVDLDAGPVTPVMRKVRVDLLAVDQRVRSVTARFDLRMRDSVHTRRLQVRGRLFLTRKAGQWRVFGYDVRKGWM